ncbi:MAG: L-threonylcarbamoyladenylate synthase [Treponema sp.]|jgi:tRNA threonylcarbamoyl adenosine modification protein (Sua5/YciO/YrdC/YwlC family)|nr:L-threonylcarbamoyladenylate synthase [Treponema sp.]
MIEYVVPGNIDDRILEKGARVLAAGGLLALPSDTSWNVVCSLHSKAGVKKLRRISGEREERYFTLLCSDISQFGEFCSIDNTRFRLIKSLSPGPYVFILNTLAGTDKSLGRRRKELAVHIPNHPIPLAVIKTLGDPLYSITAKKSMILGRGQEDEAAPVSARRAAEDKDDTELPPIPERELFEGGWELEEIEELDVILDPGEEQQRIFSTILDLTGDEAHPLRLGAGPWPI